MRSAWHVCHQAHHTDTFLRRGWQTQANTAVATYCWHTVWSGDGFGTRFVTLMLSLQCVLHLLSRCCELLCCGLQSCVTTGYPQPCIQACKNAPATPALAGRGRCHGRKIVERAEDAALHGVGTLLTALTCLYLAGRWIAQLKRGLCLNLSRVLRQRRRGQRQSPGAMKHRTGPANRPQARCSASKRPLLVLSGLPRG